VAKSGAIRRDILAAIISYGHNVITSWPNAWKVQVGNLKILLPSGELVGVMQFQHRLLEAAAAVVYPSGVPVGTGVRHLVNQFAGRRP
jgi:hypothetical protein